MSTKTESPVNRFPNARAHNEELASAVGGAPLPDTHHTSAGLPANALSKDKQELTTGLTSMRGTPWDSLDSRSNNLQPYIADHRPQTRDTAILLRIKTVWRRLALSLLFLLIPIPLTMLDDKISSVASVLGTNNSNLIYTFITMLAIPAFWFIGTKVTPAGGLEYAEKGLASLCVRAAAAEKKYATYDEDKVMAETGEEIRQFINQLRKQEKELKKAGGWKKLGKVHWGVRAVVTYHKQSWSLAKTIEKFETDSTLTAYLRGAQLPTNDAMPV
ncbi:hypothetical protein B0H11DRAFT_1911184 [Mycena galericulata]|nr:hypothetical protein B0H11DRAFT_1911184 [Mycena galericulata]